MCYAVGMGSGALIYRFMLLGEIIAVYCENHTEHIDTVWAEYIAIQSVPHRKHYVSATKPNRLMLFTVRTIRNI
jgi:hypothetical protein